MADQNTTTTVHFPVKLRDAAEGVLEKERLTMGEYLRLCIAHLAETGRAPFEIPEGSRGMKKRHGALKQAGYRTFFG